MGHGSAVVGGKYNRASGDYSFVGGGFGNQADTTNATVVGGWYNRAYGEYSFAGGGIQNVASGYSSFVGGGKRDTASGRYSFIGGGYNNTASGYHSFVAGGEYNVADGDYSFVFGRRAFTNGHDSTAVFYWGEDRGHFFIGDSAQLTNYRLYVNGSIYSSKGTYVEAPSGKTSTISAPLRKIKQLHGVAFTHDGETRTGIPADELEKVLPSAVQRAPDGHVEGVYYEQLVPVLLEVIKKQQDTIEKQQSMIKKQQARIDEQQSMIERQQADIEELKRRVSQLEKKRLR